MMSPGRLPAVLRTCVFIAAVGCLAGSVFLCINHQPQIETLEVHMDEDVPEKITTTALSYRFVYTGEYADAVQWDFGDGTYADAFEVVKEYGSPGTYNVVCEAVNIMGVRYSGYQIEIVEREGGLLEGYDAEIALLAISFLLMALTYYWPNLWTAFRGGAGRW